MSMRADAMLENGCLDGQRVWKRVLAAVKEIQPPGAAGGRGGELRLRSLFCERTLGPVL